MGKRKEERKQTAVKLEKEATHCSSLEQKRTKIWKGLIPSR